MDGVREVGRWVDSVCSFSHLVSSVVVYVEATSISSLSLSLGYFEKREDYPMCAWNSSTKQASLELVFSKSSQVRVVAMQLKLCDMRSLLHGVIGKTRKRMQRS